MKLLLDENVPPLFADQIKKAYPGSVDIHDIGYSGKSDNDIYEFLLQHKYVLMTFDLDFSDIRKSPPELVEGIIVLRFKNLKIQDLIATAQNYLEQLTVLDFRHSLSIFQNTGIRIKQRLKEIK